ncbi:hypothetical protein Tco_0045322 [Tanacetum coccineum]
MSKEVGTPRYLSLVVPPVKVGDEAVHKELGDKMERAATIASSLEAEQDSDAQTRFEAASKQSNDPPLSRVNTLGSGEDSMKIIELMAHCTTLSKLDEVMEITATIDGRVKTITEASIRRHLKLEDSDGISTLPTADIFEQLALIRYVTTSDSLTFQKGYFSPQWKFLIHTILHYLSPKKTAWEQFSSNIATAIICLATNRTFNFSNLIFEEMVKNLDSKTKFLMYPRFIQIFLNKHQRLLLPHKRTYPTPTLTQKLFSNMKRASKGYSGVRSLIEELDTDSRISLVPPHVSDQGRFDDTQVSDQPEEQLGVFSVAKVLADATEQRRDVENVQTYTRRRKAVRTASGEVSTASELVSTAGVKAKDKGKAILQESEPPKKIKKREAKFKAEQEQERLDHETAMKIQEELDVAERQRMAQVHQAAQGFTDDEWDDILARVAADKDFVQQLQAGEKVSNEDLLRKLVELVNQRKKFFAQQRAKAKRNKTMTPAQQKETGEASGSVQEQTGEEPKAEELVGGHTEAYQSFDDMLKKYDRDDLDELWNLVKERFRTTKPTKDKAREL